MTRGRTFTMIAGAAIASVLAAGCAEIPMSSGVGVSTVEDAASDPLTQIDPDGPAAGAHPSEIVRGFLAAGIGASDNFAVARSFLTEGAAEDWNPSAGVTVLPEGTEINAISTDITSDQRQVSMDVPAQGTVDGQGNFRAAPRGRSSELDFELEQVNGEWRVSQAPDGVVLTQGGFRSVYQSYALAYFDPSYGYIVPDDRWLLRRASVATDLVQRQLEGPPEWLSGAVISAIPEGAQLGTSAVTIQEGVATVALENIGQMGDRDRQLLRTQLESTLEQISTVSAVRVVLDGEEVGGTPVDAEPLVRISSQPVVVSEGALARLDGTSLVTVPDSPEVEQDAAPALAIDDDRYAYLGDDGSSMRVFDDGGESTVYSGDALLPPGFDRTGVIWTGERENEGELLALLPDGSSATVTVPFLQGRTVERVRVSRDGSRLLTLSSNGDGQQISIVGIQRDSETRPLSVSSATPLELGSEFAQIDDISWSSLDKIAVLATRDPDDGQRVWLSRVGGMAENLGEVADGISITAADDSRSIRVGTDAGTVVSHIGGSWQRLIDLDAWDPAYPG